MSRFRFNIFKTHEFVGLIYRSSKLKGSLFAENAEIKDQTVVLEHKTGELKSPNEPIGICVAHIFVGHCHIVFGCYVICQIMVHDKSEKSIEQSGVHLFVNFVKFCLQKHCRFIVCRLPNVSQVVNPLAPLVYEEGRRFLIGRFDPIWEQISLVRFVPQILIQVRISDLFKGFNIVDRNDMRIQIHKFNADLFERSMT